MEEETGRVTFGEGEAEETWGFPGQSGLIRRPEDVRPVAPDPLVPGDFTGAPHPDGGVLPGPFNALPVREKKA